MSTDHDTDADALREEWEQAERHPCLPDGDLKSFSMEEGRCIYDPENPRCYVIGPALDVGEDLPEMTEDGGCP